MKRADIMELRIAQPRGRARRPRGANPTDLHAAVTYTHNGRKTIKMRLPVQAAGPLGEVWMKDSTFLLIMGLFLLMFMFRSDLGVKSIDSAVSDGVKLSLSAPSAVNRQADPGIASDQR